MNIFDYFQLVAGNIWLYGGAFLLVLGVLVFIHEWGHYIVARLCGVKIDVFSIGFGRELFGFTDKKGTRWKFAMVPLGGYVQMFGTEDPASTKNTEEVKDDETQETRPMTADERSQAYFAKSVGQRAAIAFAGPAINYIFAIIVLAGLYMFYGQPVTPPVAAAIMGDSAAERAGFQPHDEILAIDGQKVRRFEDIRREVAIAIDTPMMFTVRRAGEEVTFEAIADRLTEEDHFGFKQTRGLLGLVGPGNAIDVTKVTMVDGQAFDDPEAARAAIIARLGQDISIALDRGAEVDSLHVHLFPALNEALSNPDHPDHNLLVIAPSPEDYVVMHSPFSAVGTAVMETVSITTSTLEALGQMFSGRRDVTELGGIIRIGALAGDMAKSGVLALITFMALLSINLGLINLFPIPMLDGGHLVFYAIEAVKGSPISEQVQEYAFRLGLVFLVGIMLFTNLNDIVQLIL